MFPSSAALNLNT
ncbi:hypothetical protein PHMEG_00034609, partial [Phytophthora megakarya]